MAFTTRASSSETELLKIILYFFNSNIDIYVHDKILCFFIVILFPRYKITNSIKVRITKNTATHKSILCHKFFLNRIKYMGLNKIASPIERMERIYNFSPYRYANHINPTKEAILTS